MDDRARAWRCGLVLVFAAGCGAPNDPRPDEDCADADGDGFGEGCEAGRDCDDDNPFVGTECPDCDADPFAAGCPCDVAEPRVCYSGPDGTLGVGACHSGLEDCIRGRWAGCDGEVVPSDEELHGHDGVDDDCNGLTDDRLCGDADDCNGNCCADGEVCLGAYCGAPGPCEDEGDCVDDTHCEPQGCVPWGEGEIDDECVGDAIEPIGEFEPELQCEWTGDPAGRHNVIIPPLVADLDPALDGAGTPEVIFTAFNEGDAFGFAGAALVAIQGDDCSERFRADEPSLSIYAPIAVGDLEGDGHLEIAGRKGAAGGGFGGGGGAFGSGLVVYDENGDVVLETDGPDSEDSCCIPTLFANLDGVGDAEILLGLTVYDSDGEIVWQVSDTLMPWGNVPVIADVDLDGEQEVVIGNRIFDGASGAEEEVFGLDNGLAAVADFDRSTPEPEIAVVAPSGVRIQTIDGDVVFGPYDTLRGTGFWGGPPVVADFDGDGEVELGAAGPTKFVVFDPDCTDDWARDGACGGGESDGILWEKATQDMTSGATGSSVFDFDADGVAEVVYNDECFTRAYDGVTGETRFIVSNSTGTAYEYPVIADVDGDGRTEIVVGANDVAPVCPDDAETGEPYEGINVGVRIWRDVLDRWAPSRRIWNQHAYSVTNVLEDGRIPEAPENNWEVAGLNNFRVNTQDDPSVAGRGIDLTVRGEGFADLCPERLVLRARVANRGTNDAPRGVAVGFYVGGPPQLGGTLACEARTTAELAPGDAQTVECDWLDPSVEPVEIWIRADPHATVTECEEENNDGRIPDVHCEGIG